jgi:hypothetical protein
MILLADDVDGEGSGGRPADVIAGGDVDAEGFTAG